MSKSDHHACARAAAAFAVVRSLAPILACSAIALAALSPAAAEPAKKSVEIPTVDVTQSKPVKAAKKKAAPKPVAEPAPVTAEAPETESARQDENAVVAPGTRSGSLGVPTTAEARAEIQRTPGGVDIVPASEYQKSGPAVTIKDALDYVPGVFVQPKWGEDSRLSIRGSGLSRNSHGRGVQLLVDGIIPITTANGSSDFQEIDPTAYRYLEVYKGANALQYGATQLGGAINFVMPTGYDSHLFGARVDVGSFGFSKVALSSGAVSGPVDYFITGTWQEQEGFRDHSSGKSTRAAMNIGYRLSKDLETRFYLNSSYIRQDIPGALTKSEALLTPKVAFVRAGNSNDNVDRDYERNLDTFRVANRTTWRITPGTVVEFGGFFMDRNLHHPISVVIENDHEEYGAFSRLVDESLIGGFKNRFIAGFSVHNGDVAARTYVTSSGNKGALASEANQLARNTVAYMENSFFVLPDVALVGGLQYAYASRKQIDYFLSNGNQSGSSDYDFWNPKAGILWDVTKTTQVFANISESKEAPTFNEISITTTSLTSLKVQEATTYEVGTRGTLPGFKWDLALYRTNLENEFQCLANAAAGTCTQINLDRSIHQGVEAGMGARLFSGIFAGATRPDEIWLNAAYTFSDFRFDGDKTYGDNQLPGAPRHFLRAELLYKHPSGFYAGPNVEWVPDSFYVDSANTLDTEAYAIYGVKAGFDNGGPISGYIEARNLEDEAYIASASIAQKASTSNNLFEPGNGFAVYSGVQFKW